MRREAGGKAAERLFGIRPCRGAGRESGWDLNRAQGDCSGRFRSLEVVFFGLIPLSGVCSLGFGGSMVAFAQVRLGCCVFFFFFLGLGDSLVRVGGFYGDGGVVYVFQCLAFLILGLGGGERIIAISCSLGGQSTYGV